MSKLNVDDLRVSSFATGEANADDVTTGQTRDPLCDSPWCGPPSIASVCGADQNA